ncbi:hypothetical protein SAMN05518672_102464 [Chitinophaga sp. CF118]|nr:hypothetical protein SAMN05518672_102464 [Chitinophaga sp. CF118]
MWSNLYWYYEIRADENYSKELSTDKIIRILENTGLLKRTTPQTFTNKDSFPWIDVCCVNSDNGNYGRPEHFNSKYCSKTRSRYQSFINRNMILL